MPFPSSHLCQCLLCKIFPRFLNPGIWMCGLKNEDLWRLLPILDEIVKCKFNPGQAHGKTITYTMIGCVLSISCFSWDKWECPRKNVFLYCLPLWAETKQLQPVAEMRSLGRQEPRGNVWRYLRSSQLGEWRRSWHLLVRDWRYCLTILHQAWEITDQILLRVKENRNKSG